MSVSKFLKARDGGELVIQDIRVRFEKGSLPADATITLSLLDSEELAFRVEPSGLVLQVPATLKTDKLDHTNGRNQTGITFLQNLNGSWSPLASLRDGNRISADVMVLGDFGIGGMTTSTSTSTEGVQLISWLDGAGYRTRLVRSDKGGSLKYGRFNLTFPPGALSQDTYITIREPGTGYMMCELEPEGIHFNVPVDLEVDLKNTGITGDGWTIFWWNPVSGRWEDQQGTFSGDKVNADLRHFSTYAPGKAGW